MKKRLFSIFVMLCMVVTMIPAMSITASAKSADTVSVRQINYSLDGKSYSLGESFTSEIELDNFKIWIEDSYRRDTYWEYTGSETAIQIDHF